MPAPVFLSSNGGLLRLLTATFLLFAVAAARAPVAAAPPPTEAPVFHEALAAAADGDWVSVRALAPRLAPELAAYFYWRELFESEREFSFATIAAFLEAHPNWPGEQRLRLLAERRIGDDVPADRIVGFFQRFPPLSATGRLALARTLQKLGRVDEARQQFTRAWPELALDPEGLRAVEAWFGDWITRDLVAARVDRLLWQGRIGEARQLLARLDDGRRSLALARIALQTAAASVDRALSAVPPKLRGDPGLAYDRLVWRLRKERYRSAQEILLAPPATLVEPERWWRWREAEIRRELESGNPQRAWALARSHRQQSGPTLAEAEWLAGWLALRFVGRPREALERFSRLYDAVTAPVSRARAAYWAGRAAEQLGQQQQADRWYRRAAAHPTTFYGQLAADRLGLTLAPGSGRIRLQTAASAAAESSSTFDPNDGRLVVARALCRLPRDQHADDFFLAVADEVDAVGAVRLLAEVRGCGRAHLHVVVAKQLALRGVVDRLQTFPLIDPAELGEHADGVDPALLAAIARQESQFDVDATSPAGARGMTQILPSTAREIAGHAGLPFSMQRLQEDPYYQMELARTHLRRLLAAYDGSLELVTAAYNAGAGRVREWIRRLGDPRRMTLEERIDWIERLPFAETRNYVQRVIEGYRVYRELLNGASDGHPLLTTGGRAIPYPAPVPRPGKGAT